MDFTIARFPGSVNGIPQIKMGGIFPQIRSFSGGAAGLAGGPVGVAVGAIVGGIASTANTVFKMDTAKKQKIEQYNMQLNAVNAQTQFSASRASLVNGGRGTEY